VTYDGEDVPARTRPASSLKGRGLVAEEIIERARRGRVPIHVSRELAALLTQVDLDQHIPPALYIAVAEVLAWVYRLEGRSAPGHSEIEGKKMGMTSPFPEPESPSWSDSPSIRRSRSPRCCAIWAKKMSC